MSSSGSAKAASSPRSSVFCRSRCSRTEGLGAVTRRPATWGPPSSTKGAETGASSSSSMSKGGVSAVSATGAAGRATLARLRRSGTAAASGSGGSDRGRVGRCGIDGRMSLDAATTSPQRSPAPKARAGAASRARTTLPIKDGCGRCASRAPWAAKPSRASPNTPPSPRASGQSAGGRGSASTPASSTAPATPTAMRLPRSWRLSRGSAAHARFSPQTIIIKAAIQAPRPRLCSPRSAMMAPARPSALCGRSPDATSRLGSAAR